MYLVACALGASLAACDSSTSPAAPPTSASSGASSTSPGGGDPSAEVLAAYRGMWADLVTAARTSDFQSPLLSQYTTGDAHTLFVQGLARDQLHGIVTRGEPVIDPRVSSLTPTGRSDPGHGDRLLRRRPLVGVHDLGSAGQKHPRWPAGHHGRSDQVERDLEGDRARGGVGRLLLTGPWPTSHPTVSGAALRTRRRREPTDRTGSPAAGR